MRINQCHWDKLLSMLRIEGSIDAAQPQTAARATGTAVTSNVSAEVAEQVFCLLLRYGLLPGGGSGSGSASSTMLGRHQAALPAPVMNTLLADFDCRFECCASPFNARYPRFCTAYPDTDTPFGGVCNFFAFKPKRGCYLLHPPAEAGLVLRMVEHMHQLLRAAEVRVCGCNMHTKRRRCQRCRH